MMERGPPQSCQELSSNYGAPQLQGCHPLKKAALDWYNSLKAGLQATFSPVHLAVHAARRKKLLVQLMNIKKDERESLRTYTRPFNDVMLEMAEVSLNTAVAMLINETGNSKRPPPSS